MTTTLRDRALQTMPGGVNSPVRAFHSVGGEPIFAQRAEGAVLETSDGRSFIDFCMSFGPLVLGHAHPAVVEAVQSAAARGTSFAVTTEAEIELGEMICEAVTGVERVRLVNSGTEACMTAVRLARGYTGRSKVLKFSGCYHGHLDGLLVEAGSGVAGIAAASSDGIPEAMARETLVAPYNDFDAVNRIFEEYGDEIALVAVEPVAANMGLVFPAEGFLELLRTRCTENGALLLFDEVITGFRLTYGGYQNLCGITPDLTCLGKVIGGGMPIGAVGGRAEIMDKLAPAGPVYQAGTLSGNPVSVAAGLANLRTLRDTKPYLELDRRTTGFVDELGMLARDAGLPLSLPQAGSLFALFFTQGPVTCFDEVMACDKERFQKLFHLLMERGVYLAPSPFEAAFLSTAHDEATLARALEAFKEAFAAL